MNFLLKPKITSKSVSAVADYFLPRNKAVTMPYSKKY